MTSAATGRGSARIGSATVVEDRGRFDPFAWEVLRRYGPDRLRTLDRSRGEADRRRPRWHRILNPRDDAVRVRPWTPLEGSGEHAVVCGLEELTTRPLGVVGEGFSQPLKPLLEGRCGRECIGHSVHRREPMDGAAVTDALDFRHDRFLSALAPWPLADRAVKDVESCGISSKGCAVVPWTPDRRRLHGQGM